MAAEAVVHPDGRVVFAGQTVRAVLGKGGVCAPAAKREGDGATPSGVLVIRRVLYRADRLAPPAAALSIEPIAPDDGWCDDPSHPDYNRMVRLPHPARHEALWRGDGLYDLIGVLGWNDAPVARGRGSAIFLHVARADGAPTEGCIALALPDLRRLLAARITALAVRRA
ncbi:MAG: L,D-transpeptidase family protein [Alphaproteobacteria bacterium]|nr:L,D-transpeptidase family protein [Alphaproteobacteria bacterium]